jgi:predicted polyphosphate/ATP-dependent NAD kinase
MWSPIPRKGEGGKRLGLIVNPLAGIGGKVGLKGSDGAEIQRRAIELGAVPEAERRTALAIKTLLPWQQDWEIITCPGEMGESVLRQHEIHPLVIGEIKPGATTPEDTRLAAQVMLGSQVDVLLFAGGDGTARDIYTAIGDQLVVIGIPAGVKIHSAVFATHPYAAGELAMEYLRNRAGRLYEAEVIDLDEEAYRAGSVSTRLFGYLNVPYHRRLLQDSKAPSPPAETAQMEAIAYDVVEQMHPGCLYILGPGTTTRAIADRLGVEKTLVGVDVVTREGLVALDVSESRLLKIIRGQEAKIIVTPIGGQGFLFGRGNQPISPAVIRSVGREHIQVVSTPAKLASLAGHPLLVDSGDPELDAQISGYIAITTGCRERAIYRVTA